MDGFLDAVARTNIAEKATSEADASLLLVQRACAGDREAFSQLIETHYDFIFRVAFKWLGRQEEAEDVAQDVCVKLSRILPSFQAQSLFRSWLYTVVINAARDRVRKAARRPEVVPDNLDDIGAVAPDSASTTAENNDLWRAVRSLPPRQADAVLLVYAEERSHAETAEILGCSEKTVSWHIHEAKKALRSLL